MPTVPELLTDPDFARQVEDNRKFMIEMSKLQDPHLRRELTECKVVGCDGQHTVNVPLLRKVLDQITSHPDSWDQGSWASYALPEDRYGLSDALPFASELCRNAEDFPEGVLLDETVLSCGSAFCVAGWAVQFTGHTMVTDSEEVNYAETYGSRRVYAFWVDSVGKSGNPVAISEQARHELGLSLAEARALFGASNTLPMVVGYCQALAESVGESLF